MRLGINTLFLVPGDVGGTEVYLRQNLKHMVFNNREHTFVLFTSSDNDLSLKNELSKYPNILYRQLPLRSSIRPLRILFEQILLPWFVLLNDIDVLWSPGYTAPLLCFCPQAVTIHDLQYKSHPEDFNFLERRALDLLVRIACLTCSAVIAVSQFSKRELLRFRFGLPKKIFVVPEGVDPGFRNTEHSKTFSHAGLFPGAPYILCVAHTYPHKKVHVLVKAFDRVAAEIPHHLVLVGKSRRGEILLKDALNNSINKKRIHRFYRLPENDLHAVYQNADLFVLPSVYEGFGLPVLEAMIAGTPVITTEKASLPEVGGHHAFYVENSAVKAIAKKIITVINMDKTEKKAIVEKGRSWSKSFTWSKSADSTMKILKRLAINKTGY